MLLGCLSKHEDLMREMHIIAYVYHWGRESLWDCPILERREWIKLIIEQKEAERKAIKGDSETSIEDMNFN